MSAVCLAAAAAGCSGQPGQTAEAPSAGPSPSAQALTSASATSPAVSSFPIGAGAYPPDAVIGGLDVSGAEPIFSWTPIPEAASYTVVVARADPTLPEFPWVWDGAATSVAYGVDSDDSVPLASPSPQTMQRDGQYTWLVIAYDANGSVLVSSEVTPFTCADPCGQ
jgi:hypothetical protein